MESKLCDIISHLANNVSYYKERLPKYINPHEQIDIFLEIPIITKETVKSNYIDFFCDQLKENDLNFLFNNEYYKVKTHPFILENGMSILVSFTSGTSGTPMMIIRTPDEQLKLNAEIWRLRNKVSHIEPKNLLYRVHLNSADYPFPFDPNKKVEYRIADEIAYLNNNKRYKWWHIQAQDLEKYYQHIIKYSIDFNIDKILQYIEYTSSFVSNEVRKIYAETFKCNIIDLYGCLEIWSISQSCKHGYHHVNERSVIFEIINQNGCIISEPNKIGRVVVTSLIQKVMPFIRYKLSDKAYYMESACECGNPAKRIVFVHGDERIVGTKKNGKKYFETIVDMMIDDYNIDNYLSIHVTQVSANEFDVNTRRLLGSTETFQKKFEEIASCLYPEDKYKYYFTYNDALIFEDIFSVSFK